MREGNNGGQGGEGVQEGTEENSGDVEGVNGGCRRKTNAQFGIEILEQKRGPRYENVTESCVVNMLGESRLKESRGQQEIDEGEQEEPSDNGEENSKREGSESGTSFSEGVREAIANVEATHRDGEERLMRILEDLEGRMVTERSEEDAIMKRIQKYNDKTPRRSVRVAEKGKEAKK